MEYNINDEQLNKLADLIVKKIIAKQNHVYLLALEEEDLLGELARLTTMLQLYEDGEKYEKAQIIKRKMDILSIKINKINIKIKDHDKGNDDDDI
jgi:hypothetical protein|tara:strand:- start:361 stop:645 length:285 start_codon:yes stop_codon:yes gene_type:complete